MSKQQVNPEAELKTIPGTPVLSRVNYPVIEIKDRKIFVTLDTADNNKLQLNFQPYQAFKLTTRDCYLNPDKSAYSNNKVLYQQSSSWIEELKSALQVIDASANFMNKALHFIILAGDDVLEIVAWKVEIKHSDKTFSFPEGVKTFPF